MFNLGKFISENVTFRPKSMFLADGILMQLRCEIKSSLDYCNPPLPSYICSAKLKMLHYLKI